MGVTAGGPLPRAALLAAAACWCVCAAVAAEQPSPRRAMLEEPVVEQAAASADAAADDSLGAVAARAVQTPSHCVPADTVVVAWANHHHQPLFR